MAKQTVRVEGLRELERALGELPKKSTGKAVLRRVLKKRAEPVAEAMRQRAPDDPATQEGDLKSSIGVSTKLSPRQRREHKGEERSTVEMFVGAGPVPQAHLQEFGTVTNRPQPFARPAWDQNKRGVLDGIAEDLGEEIQKSAARLARKAGG